MVGSDSVLINQKPEGQMVRDKIRERVVHRVP